MECEWPSVKVLFTTGPKRNFRLSYLSSSELKLTEKTEFVHGCFWGSRHKNFSVTAVMNRWIKKKTWKRLFCIIPLNHPNTGILYTYPRWPDNISSHLRFVTYIFTCCESMGLQYCKGILDRKSADNKLITVSMRVAWDNLWTFSNS